MPGAPAPFLPSAASNETEKEPDPERQFWEDFWDNWREAAYEERVAIIERMLREQPELVDGGVAFDMFVDLHEQAARNEEWPRFNALADLLMQQAPAAYEEEEHYFLGWRIENALAMGQHASVMALFNALAGLAGTHIDEFDRMVEKLAYHGDLSSLVSGYRIALPEVKTSSDIVSWGVSEFVNRAISYESFARLEQQPDLQADDAELLNRLRTERDKEKFAEYLGYLSGRHLPEWALADCTLPSISHKEKSWWEEEDEEEEEPAVAPEYHNLHLLTVAFIHDWHTTERTPYTKAELARSHIYSYLMQRHRGDLAPVDDFPFSQRPVKRKRKKQRDQPADSHPLCPDRQTLDRYMALLIGFLSGRYHAAGALLEAVPAWLRFLQKYELIDGDQAGEALASLKKLAADWKDAVERATSDPLLRANAVKLYESW